MLLAEDTLDNINPGETTLSAAATASDVKVDGNEQSVTDFLGILDTFPFWFNIVTP